MTEQNQDGKATDNGAQQNTQQNGNGTDNAGHMIPKSRFDQVVNQRNELEATLTGLAAEVRAEVPEDMQDLIPAKLSPQDQIIWIRNAMKKGLFTKQAPDGIDTKRPGGKQAPNYDGMSPQTMMAMGYKTK